MKFRPYDKKIENIFGGSNTYTIPNFQRDYSWKQKNYDDFLNDLLSASHALYNISEKELSINNGDDTDYFFGTILVIGEDSKADINKPYIVVDGQQRLTTMTLFFAALKRRIMETDTSYDQTYSSALVVSSVREGKTKEYARLQNKSLTPILPVNILDLNNHKTNGTQHEALNRSQEWLMESYDIFYKMLDRKKIAQRLNRNKGSKKDYEDITDENYVNFIDNLGRQLLNSTVVIIFSEDENSANILYRNFNYRGIPLSQSDLIKNEIFSLLDDNSESTLTTWKNIENNVFSVEESMSTFLFHYMVSKYGQVTKSNLFNSFLKNVKQDSGQLTNFLRDAKLNSSYYKSIIRPSDDEKLFKKQNFFKTDSNPQIKRQLIFLDVIDTTQVRILLLALFSARDTEKISSTNFRKIINIISAHQSIHVLASTSANKLTPIYKKYSKIFRNVNKAETHANILDLLEDFRKILPPVETVIMKAHLSYDHNVTIKEMNFNQKKNRFLIKQILYSLAEARQSDASQSGNDGLKFIYDATLEHIIDQENDSIFNVNSLGNLILLEQDKHSNSKDKEVMYSNSDITLTKTLFKDYKNFSSEKDIEQRNNKLLTEYYKFVKELV